MVQCTLVVMYSQSGLTVQMKCRTIMLNSDAVDPDRPPPRRTGVMGGWSPVSVPRRAPTIPPASSSAMYAPYEPCDACEAAGNECTTMQGRRRVSC